MATLLYCERGACGPDGAAADTQAAALGFLQQHRADQRRDDHEVNDDNDSLHLYLPSQTKSAEVRLLIRACGV